MGIQGLLPFLQKCSRKVDMSEFSGCTVAIDVYCWLHKGAFSCAEKLARGEDTDQYVQYCMKYVNMLLSHNIKPILVFDGCHLPAKAETEKLRREKRESTKKKAGELLRSEKIDEARQMLRRCVDITHPMAHKLITRARMANIDCIVAPFEADAQLAYLNISGIAQFVITEDSDLLLFGCTKVVFKLDIGGAGLLVEQEMLPIAMKMRPEEFTLDKFRQMCVLSGCDYLPSLPGIGLTKACKFVKLTSQNDISKILHKIGSYLNMPNLTVPEDYKYKFIHAMGMFRHQPAFDPIKRCVVPLTPIDEGADVVLPKAQPPEIALQLALGNIDPITMKVVDDWNPDSQLKEQFKNKSIWSENYRRPITSLPTCRKLKTSPVKSTFGKRMSVSLAEIIEPTKQIRSEEEEIEEMRETWGVRKKRRLDDLEEEGKEALQDEVVSPSPPRPNPFKASSQTNTGNIQLTDSTTLNRLTSPKCESKISSPQKISASCQVKSSFSKFTSFSSSSVETKTPLVISRYFAGSAGKGLPSESPNCSISNPKDTEPVIVPESPDKSGESSKIKDQKPTKRNIFLVSPPQIVENNEFATENIMETNNTNKSFLSAMEDEDENTYKNSGLNKKICSKNGLSNFKWKPLVPLDKLTGVNNDNGQKPAEEVFLDTPPNSQESEGMGVPKLSTSLKPARTVGLSKNKSPAMQTFLSKFKFQPKAKVMRMKH